MCHGREPHSPSHTASRWKLPVPPALATGATLCLLMEPGRLRTRGNALDFSLFSLGPSQAWLMGDLFFQMFNLAVPPFLPLLVPESTV